MDTIIKSGIKNICKLRKKNDSLVRYGPTLLSQQTQNICITFEVAQTLYTCYTKCFVFAGVCHSANY